MIKFENTKVFNFEGAFRGMRNPLNSWDKSDSGFCDIWEECRVGCTLCDEPQSDMIVGDPYILGAEDLKLAKNLINAGSDHRKFLRQIMVSVDITAPLYWWKEFDTYKVGTVANSCSTMHKIHAKPFEISDFSYDHLGVKNENLLRCIIKCLNENRDKYIECAEALKHNNFETWGDGQACKTDQKMYWWQMIQLLPTSYNQRRTVTLNYETLRNIRGSRRGHKLDEWRIDFIKWIDSLPYADPLIIS
jgi:hypothetical protein